MPNTSLKNDGSRTTSSLRYCPIDLGKSLPISFSMFRFCVMASCLNCTKLSISSRHDIMPSAFLLTNSFRLLSKALCLPCTVSSRNCPERLPRCIGIVLGLGFILLIRFTKGDSAYASKQLAIVVIFTRKSGSRIISSGITVSPRSSIRILTRFSCAPSHSTVFRYDQSALPSRVNILFPLP